MFSAYFVFFLLLKTPAALYTTHFYYILVRGLFTQFSKQDSTPSLLFFSSSSFFSTTHSLDSCCFVFSGEEEGRYTCTFSSYYYILMCIDQFQSMQKFLIIIQCLYSLDQQYMREL